MSSSIWQDVGPFAPPPSIDAEVKEDWEQMLDDDDDDDDDDRRDGTREGAVDGRLSEEARRKLALEAAELEENLELGKALLGETLLSTTSGRRTDACKDMDNSKASIVTTSTGVHALKITANSNRALSGAKKAGDYSIDASLPKSKSEFEALSGALHEKISQFEGSAHYGGFVGGLIRQLAGGLSLADTKKLVGELQTLANVKAQKPAAGGSKAKTAAGGTRPSLKFGGSLKTTFDHDYQDYADEEGYGLY